MMILQTLATQGALDNVRSTDYNTIPTLALLDTLYSILTAIGILQRTYVGSNAPNTQSVTIFYEDMHLESISILSLQFHTYP